MVLNVEMKSSKKKTRLVKKIKSSVWDIRLET